MPAQARFGERVPVPVTVFSPIATGGVAQQPITSFNYENIGVNIDITPRTHHDGQVSLALKILVSSISGTGFGGLPTFGNREINTVIRLQDGETNLLAGLIRDNERRVVEGVPGLIDLPLVGRLFAHNRRESQESDIVLTLTPRIVRLLNLTEDDLRPFRVGRAGTAGTGGVIDLPVVLEPTPQLPPAAQPQPAQPTAPPPDMPLPPAAPIQPPAPQPTPAPPPPLGAIPPGSIRPSPPVPRAPAGARPAGCSPVQPFRAATRATALRQPAPQRSTTFRSAGRGCRARGRHAGESAR